MASSKHRPPVTTRSSYSSISSSSVAPSSPGPSVSLRGAAARSPTPTTAGMSSVPASARGSPNPSYLNARSTSGSNSNTYGMASSSNSAIHTRDRSMSGVSSITTSTRTPAHSHNRRRPTLMGGGGSRLGKNQLANLAASNNVGIPAVPPILINGTERPEDVDISSIGRMPSNSIKNTHTHTSSLEATSAGVDNLFSRFGVKEIRSISLRGRLKADSKKDELRTMVGERYRDLLGAADSIVRMRRSSRTLLGKLGRARDECDRELMASRAAEEDMTRSRLIQPITSATTDAHTPYSIATLVKLLLDCPEHIWRSIEGEDYLSAARLEGVGRAVYRELISSGKGKKKRTEDVFDGSDMEDTEGQEGDDLLAVFPLLQQSGDSLDQLGPQISHRANMHLRNWDVSASTTAHSLASILMLDNTSIPEALRITLEQRTKTLSALFDDSSASTGVLAPTPRRASVQPSSQLLLQSSTFGASAAREVDEVLKRTVEALGLILRTHEHVKSIFVSTEEGGKEPLLLGLLSLIQQQPSAAPAGETTSTPAAPPLSSDTAVLPVLNTLPNAHLLLRYLPSQIVSFTPFIDTTSARNDLSASEVQRSLSAWFEGSLVTLEEGLRKMFATLSSAKQLAQVQRSLQTFLSSATSTKSNSEGTQWQLPTDSLQQTLDRIFQSRFTEIYTLRLQDLSSSLRDSLQNALLSLPDSSEDLDPTLFLFSSSMPFPSSSMFSNTSQVSMGKLARETDSDPFVVFKRAIERRVAGRSPVLAACLSGLEGTARNIREDVTAWLGTTQSGNESSSQREYEERVNAILVEIQETFAETLKETKGVDQKLFIGSLAQHVTLDSTLVQDLLLVDVAGTAVPDEVAKALRQIEADSILEWRMSAVEEAITSLKDSIREGLSRPASVTADKPSEYLFYSLSILIQAIRKLGPHRCQASPSAVQQLLEFYEEGLVESMFADMLERLREVSKTRRAAHAVQMQLDVGFLWGVLKNALGRQDDQKKEGWTKLEQELQELAPTSADLLRSSTQAFQRTQTLLAPLFPSLHHLYATQSGESTSATSLLMPFGTPATLLASDTKLELAKPGPRFALLQISQTAA